jgi:hypothetical protein
MAVAHNEWLELNKKEFAMYPLVRTLDGMMRQGQFIGKRVTAPQRRN